MTTESINVNEITEELKAIRKDLNFIKSHMFDEDCILMKEEEKRAEEAIEEYKLGKAVPLKVFEKEMNK
jgi:hypothetical protein